MLKFKESVYTSRGQVIVIGPIFILVALYVIALVIDVHNWASANSDAKSAIRLACGSAANTQFKGGNATVDFYQVMADNNIPAEGYQPTVGSGLALAKGISFEADALRVAVKFETDTYLMTLLGFKKVPVSQHARCSTTGGLITPILVPELTWEQSYNGGHNPKEVDILGKGTDLNVIQSGNNFAGAGFPFIVCEDGYGQPNYNCAYKISYPPLPPNPPPSPQTAKDVLATCWDGKTCNNVMVPVGSRIPIVSGVSNAQLVKAAIEAGLNEGEEIIVLVFDGTVTKPDPSYSSTWENVAITGYAKFTITKTNANTLTAIATSPILSWDQLMDYDGKPLYPGEIPWDATKGWY